MANKMRMVSILQSVDHNDNASTDKIFSMSSDSTAIVLLKTGELKRFNQFDCKTIIAEIINSIFDKKIEGAVISSSELSLSDSFEGSEEMDERLKRWQDTLRDRKKIQEKILRKTGKKTNEMLFNLPTTVEHRDKGTIQRLMNYAARMNPIALSQKMPDVLPEQINKHTGMCIPQLQETLPKAERTGQIDVEFSGLSKSIKRELLGQERTMKTMTSVQNSKWLKSKVLEEHINENEEDIKRVLEHCPNIDRLEVVGRNNAEAFRTDDINLVESENLHTISSSTGSLTDESQIKSVCSIKRTITPEDKSVGIKINDREYTVEKRNIPFGVLNVYFECEPYQMQMKEVVRLENIGKRVIICDWYKSFEGYKRWTDCDRCFLFDSSLVVLSPGEVYVAKALFQPHSVSLGKQRWELRIFPNILCIQRGALSIQLFGKCVPSSLYSAKVDCHLKLVVDKCNDQALRKLTTLQGKLAPVIETPDMLCPYERPLDERDLFNAQNVGYHCDRYDDLEDLKALFNTLKMPREPAWDLRLNTIREAIIRLPNPEDRESIFQYLLKIQEAMKSMDNKPYTFDHSLERDRTCFIYVRGCIANGIEEWEELMMAVEQSCLKSEAINFYALPGDEAEEEDTASEGENVWLRQLKHENLEKYLLLKLRAKKYYRDSLYIQTYTLICDIAENLASIIESTKYV